MKRVEKEKQQLLPLEARIYLGGGLKLKNLSLFV